MIAENHHLPAGNSIEGKVRQTTVHIPEGTDLNHLAFEDDSYLPEILQTQRLLKSLKSKQITFSSPILSHGENAILYANTINVIQGQGGVHKSRLAQLLCSCFLKRPDCKNEMAGFTADMGSGYTVCYVDTERNLKEQLPFALQTIQLQAGYSIEAHPNGFDYISLLNIPRLDRFTALQQYLDYVRQTSSNHIFIVLDVATDCVRDFNRSDDSMQLIDLLNMAINNFNVTFLCIIHENPGQEKARGHLGTEMFNKASTQMQIAFEKDSDGNESDFIRVKFLKFRANKRPSPIYLKVCEETKYLVLADEMEIKELVDSRRQKATLSDVCEQLEIYLSDGAMKNAELVEKLAADFDTSGRTIRDRLTEIIDGKIKLTDGTGETCALMKGKEGREVVFQLKPINQI